MKEKKHEDDELVEGNLMRCSLGRLQVTQLVRARLLWIFLPFGVAIYVVFAFISPSSSTSFLPSLASYLELGEGNQTTEEQEWLIITNASATVLMKIAAKSEMVNEQPVEKAELRRAVHILRNNTPFHPFKFLVRPSVCTANKFAKILVYVAIGPYQAKLRRALRSTWGDKAKTQGIELVFAMGRASGNLSLSGLDILAATHENERYGDILMANYEDSYKHLIVKYWTDLDFHVHHCSHIPFMAHIDADTVIYAENFENFLAHHAQEYVNDLGCQVFHGTREKNPNHIWHVSDDLWPEDTLHAYCHGIMIMASSRSAKAMLDALPLLGIDYFTAFTIWDVATGPLAKVAKVGLRNLPGLYATFPKEVACDNTTVAVHSIKGIAQLEWIARFRKDCCVSGHSVCK